MSIWPPLAKHLSVCRHKCVHLPPHPLTDDVKFTVSQCLFRCNNASWGLSEQSLDPFGPISPQLALLLAHESNDTTLVCSSQFSILNQRVKVRDNCLLACDILLTVIHHPVYLHSFFFSLIIFLNNYSSEA